MNKGLLFAIIAGIVVPTLLGMVHEAWLALCKEAAEFIRDRGSACGLAPAAEGPPAAAAD
jgi:hypothetical protein